MGVQPAQPRVLPAPFAPSADRRSALDRAHRGDIEGALGRVESFDTGPRLSLARHLGTLLAIIGPGLIVMAADNDAGTFSIYAQAGQDYGLAILWPFLLLGPTLFIVQEMVARLGAVTGAGHARLIFERFGAGWGRFALGDLLALNVLMIVTEFIGVNLALAYFGVTRYLSVPIAGMILVVTTASGRFRRWERVMCLMVAANALVIPLALMSHPRGAAVASALVPHLPSTVRAGGVLFLVALVGTTVSPWQLFFQQSNVVDKRITARWLNYERVDTLLGTILFLGAGIAVIGTCAFAFGSTPLHGAFSNAGSVAQALAQHVGSSAGTLFALALLNASILGAGVITLTTSYAIGDVFGTKNSLHRSWRDARHFHASFVIVIGIAVAVALVPGAPLATITLVVQALAGILLPSATVFLLLLCNDPAVLGPRTNPRWLNAVATVIVGALLVLSALLTATTLLPGLNIATAAIVLTVVLTAVLAFLAGHSLLAPATPRPDYGTPAERRVWTMPPLETLPRATLGGWRRFGLVVLRCYLAVAVALLLVKAVALS